MIRVRASVEKHAYVGHCQLCDAHLNLTQAWVTDKQPDFVDIEASSHHTGILVRFTQFREQAGIEQLIYSPISLLVFPVREISRSVLAQGEA